MLIGFSGSVIRGRGCPYYCLVFYLLDFMYLGHLTRFFGGNRKKVKIRFFSHVPLRALLKRSARFLQRFRFVGRINLLLVKSRIFRFGGKSKVKVKGKRKSIKLRVISRKRRGISRKLRVILQKRRLVLRRLRRRRVVRYKAAKRIFSLNVLLFRVTTRSFMPLVRLLKFSGVERYQWRSQRRRKGWSAGLFEKGRRRRRIVGLRRDL